MSVPARNNPSLPVLKLDANTDHKSLYEGNYEVYLFEGGRQLLVSKKEVIIIRGSSIVRKLKYDDDIICATYTTFGDKSSKEDSKKALAVCLKKTACIIYPNGTSYTLSMPFSLKNAVIFEIGLILERDQRCSRAISEDKGQLFVQNSAKFLTMVDPIEEFRVIISSSTTTISPNETLKYFPPSLSQGSICVTYNAYEMTLNYYHVKSSSRTSKKQLFRSSSQPKKKFSLLSTPNPNRVYEEENMHIDHHFEGSNSLSNNYQSMSINMEKKRTSTLLSDISSMARMSSEPNFPESASINKHVAFDFVSYKKDMILSKIDRIQLENIDADISVKGIWFENQEALVVKISNFRARIDIFKHDIGHPPKFQSTLEVACKDFSPLISSERKGYLILLKDEKSISIFNPFLEVESFEVDLSSQFSALHHISSSYDDKVALTCVDGGSAIVKLMISPSCYLTKACLECIKYLSGSKVYETFALLCNAALSIEDSKNDWNAFVVALLSIVYPFEDGIPKSTNYVTELLPKAKLLSDKSKLSYSFSDLIPYITLSLHLIREEMRLNILTDDYVQKLGVLLAQLTFWMGWPEVWHRYYMIEEKTIERNNRFLSVCILGFPPNIYQSLVGLINMKMSSYLRISELVEEDESVDISLTPVTHKVLKIFELILSRHFQPSSLIDAMMELSISRNDLETLPLGIALPIKEALLECQNNPNFRWSKESLELVGRKDLRALVELDKTSYLNTQSKTSIPHIASSQRDIKSILSNVLRRHGSVSAWDDQSEADRISITKLIFDYDRRYYEITTLLHQTKIQSATLEISEDLLEYEIFAKQRELAALVALRTLTIPMGRSALFYGGRMPLLTEKFPIPKFNFSTLISPMMTNIFLSKGAVTEHVLNWGYFHNGVSSGLSISPNSKGISGSWIIFNKPQDLNSQHAGFLLGLGLNGHLKKLEEWHIYNYLGPKHPLTSVGLLIGMAASLKRSMDNKLTKVLSVHAVALLPQGANDLNVPTVVQTAGLIGIGLLYLETQHRRMSEILLSQITSSVFQNDTEIIDEGYRIATGISLGLVNLGKGDDLRGLNDTHVVDKLTTLAVSMRDFQPIEELDKSACGAILALGLIYLRTGNASVANKLKIPETLQLLDYIRPDVLLLRCMAKNLIMWDEIGCTLDWIESEIPSSLTCSISLSNIKELDSDLSSFFNIVGGLCIAMAIKYASSQNLQVRDTLIQILDQLMKITETEPINFDQKMAYDSASNIKFLIAMCLGIVMSASGNLEAFRRLRALQMNTSKFMDYGKYMAINSALGFLFLGGGQYAFSSSNFSVACLLISLYPIFPKSDQENEVHLQALRHFWALSVEARCLITRDVDTREPCKIPIFIKYKDSSVSQVYSPYLLPDLSTIAHISTSSDDHFNIQIDFTINSSNLEAFRKHHTIFVYKKKNYELFKLSIRNLLKNENKKLQVDNGEITLSDDYSKIMNFSFMKNISKFEKQALLFENNAETSNLDFSLPNNGLTIFDTIDSKIELEQLASRPKTVDSLWNLKLILSYTDNALHNGLRFINFEFIESQKQKLWSLAHA